MNHIVFTHDINTVLTDTLRPYAPDSIFFLVDTNTRGFCLSIIDRKMIAEQNIIEIESGEEHKTLESVARIWSVLSSRGARRNAVLVNVGGGLVTDVGGFAASCFKRGIKCVNIPTTLLAQVDASVGGKTGINFNGLKNEIGTFSIPGSVIIDSCFLKTLSDRQILSGFAEMLKHALLKGGEHFKEIMEITPGQMRQDDFVDLIRESVNVKAEIVENDPKESGVRKALNLGHTVGHAIESCAIARGAELYHGDAVAYGIIAELFLSVNKMGFDPALYSRIRRFITGMYPPYRLSADADELYTLMLHDKKNEREGVNFTLLRQPGSFTIDNYCCKEEIVEALKQLL